MRLTKVTLWNYRSYWSDNITPSAEIDLAKGVNYIVGPNNVGKSNLLRAVGQALDPSSTHNPAIDKPQGIDFGTQIVLEFHAGAEPKGDIKKLLEHVEAYERTIEGFKEPSLASEGIVRFFVWLWNGQRDERFVTRGSLDKGKAVGRNNVRQRAVDKFHEVVRFVDIKSGEDLQGLLQRGFKEILASALGAGHGKAMKEAEQARVAYIDALGHILRPVAKHVEDRLGRYVRDIREVDLQARVPFVEDALADAEVIIQDAVKTTLEQKGTGVRGAMLLMLLSFIADSSKTAVVFGIEEPESFLHPEAHRQLGEGLERFTQRDDITMLVTTHSPFLFRPEGGDSRSAVFVVRKDEQGRSTVTQDKDGAARADLLGSRALAALLERAEEVPDWARMILLVEGFFDREYLTLAAKKLGISLDGVHIVMSGSAGNAALQALTMAARHAPGRLVVALFDADKSGLEGANLLADRFAWKKKAAEGLHVLTYAKWIASSEKDVEAEDVFTNATMAAFLAAPGHQEHCDAKVKRNNGLWHYGLTNAGKKAFLAWLQEHGTAETFAPWKPVLEHLRLLVDGAAEKKK